MTSVDVRGELRGGVNEDGDSAVFGSGVSLFILVNEEFSSV